MEWNNLDTFRDNSESLNNLEKSILQFKIQS